ncbi:hypothetical protein [Shewanella algae]
MEPLDKIKEKFSRKQEKISEEIEPLVGKDVSIALTGLKNTERTSFYEIRVIATLMSAYAPIKIESFSSDNTPLILQGEGPRGYAVKIIPQYKVKNTIQNAPPWSIDLVLELYRKQGADLDYIASIGVEYDGYPTHFLESNVKKSYLRDVGIVSETGIQSIRIAKEAWEKDHSLFITAIKKFFEHKIEIIDRTTKKSIRKYQESINKANGQKLKNSNEYVCPKCIGNCAINGFPCNYCLGKGSVDRLKSGLFNRYKHGYVRCHRCFGNSRRCQTCKGSGILNVPEVGASWV